MKQITPFYTVIVVPSGRFTIRYVTPPDWTVREIGRNYDDDLCDCGDPDCFGDCWDGEDDGVIYYE